MTKQPSPSKKGSETATYYTLGTSFVVIGVVFLGARMANGLDTAMWLTFLMVGVAFLCLAFDNARKSKKK